MQDASTYGAVITLLLMFSNEMIKNKIPEMIWHKWCHFLRTTQLYFSMCVWAECLTNNDSAVVHDHELAVHVNEFSDQTPIQVSMSAQTAERDVLDPAICHCRQTQIHILSSSLSCSNELQSCNPHLMDVILKLRLQSRFILLHTGLLTHTFEPLNNGVLPSAHCPVMEKERFHFSCFLSCTNHMS